MRYRDAGENGLSLVAWLRKQGRQTKCIFLTAHADFPYAQKALQLGAVDYLLQPASYQSIETAIRGAAEQLQEERLSQVYEALGKSVERETLDFRRNVLREYLLGIRRGPQKVAEKAAAFGFLASSRAYRCALIAIQEPAKNQTDDFSALRHSKCFGRASAGLCGAGYSPLSGAKNVPGHPGPGRQSPRGGGAVH